MPEKIDVTLVLIDRIESDIIKAITEYKLDYTTENVKALALLLSDMGLRFLYGKTKSIEDLEDMSQLIKGRVDELIDSFSKKDPYAEE